MKILYDAFDLLLLRVKPLEAYRYPSWQVWAVLAGISLAVGSMSGMRTDPVSRGLFVFLYNAAQCWAISRFMQVWLRLRFGRQARPLSAWSGEGSLFTLLVLLQGIEFTLPLLSWFAPATRFVFGTSLFVYGTVVLVLGLARATGAPARAVLAGLILMAPMLLLIFMLFVNLALGWGWIDLQEFRPPPSAVRPTA